MTQQTAKLTDPEIEEVFSIINSMLVYLVDVTDTTDHPAGSSKKATAETLKKFFEIFNFFYQPGRVWKAGELSVHNGALHICNPPFPTTTTTGLFNPAHWTSLTQANSNFQFPEYLDLNAYNINEVVRNGNQIYRSLQNGNIGNALTNTLWWEEISPDQSQPITSAPPTWTAGNYVNGQTVKHLYTNGGAYIVYFANGNFYSSDIEAEIPLGQWQPLSFIIDDADETDNKLWSSQRVKSEISAAITALINTAPGTLDTLNELAAALGNDPNFATTITALIATKANDSDVVKLTGNQTVVGVKTFSSAPVSSAAAANNNELMRKGEVDAALSSKAALTQSDFISITVEFPENGTYLLVVNTPYAFTINSITTKAESGTCTATFNINGVALGGSANAVSSSKVTQSHTTSNALAVGDDLNLVISSNSSTRKLSVTIRISRVLANA